MMSRIWLPLLLLCSLLCLVVVSAKTEVVKLPSGSSLEFEVEPGVFSQADEIKHQPFVNEQQPTAEEHENVQLIEQGTEAEAESEAEAETEVDVEAETETEAEADGEKKELPVPSPTNIRFESTDSTKIEQEPQPLELGQKWSKEAAERQAIRNKNKATRQANKQAAQEAQAVKAFEAASEALKQQEKNLIMAANTRYIGPLKPLPAAPKELGDYQYWIPPPAAVVAAPGAVVSVPVNAQQAAAPVAPATSLPAASTPTPAAAAPAPVPAPAPVAVKTPLGDRVLIEQDVASEGMVEAEVVDVLTTDGSVYHPQAAAAPAQGHVSMVETHSGPVADGNEAHPSLLDSASQTTSHLGVSASAGWQEPTYHVDLAAEAKAHAEEVAKAQEPEFIHPMLIEHEKPKAAAGATKKAATPKLNLKPVPKPVNLRFPSQDSTKPEAQPQPLELGQKWAAESAERAAIKRANAATKRADRAEKQAKAAAAKYEAAQKELVAQEKRLIEAANSRYIGPLHPLPPAPKELGDYQYWIPPPAPVVPVPGAVIPVPIAPTPVAPTPVPVAPVAPVTPAAPVAPVAPIPAVTPTPAVAPVPAPVAPPAPVPVPVAAPVAPVPPIAAVLVKPAPPAPVPAPPAPVSAPPASHTAAPSAPVPPPPAPVPVPVGAKAATPAVQPRFSTVSSETEHEQQPTPITTNLEALSSARAAVASRVSAADIVVPIDEALLVSNDHTWADAPAAYVADQFWPKNGERSPQQQRAINVLNNAYTAPEFYPVKKPAVQSATRSNNFHCRSPASHPIQAPVFTSSYGSTPAYTCAVSPFISGQSWQSCHQQHQTCYLSCQSTQVQCDEQFQHCIMTACGTGVISKFCTTPPTASATDPSQTEKNYPVCVANLLPLITAKYFNTTSYTKCQSHACMCVNTPVAERVQPNYAIVQPPSALESWPFYTIDLNNNAPTSFIETESSASRVSAASLYDQMDIHDFLPSISSLGTDLHPTITDRADVRAMSSASEVIGVDYTSETGIVKAGLVVAKGKRVLEHYIPTCARLAGGRQLGIFKSFVGIDGSAPHELYMGVTQQGQGRGLIMTTNLIVVIFEDKIEIWNQWTPSLMTVHPSALGVVTLQLWSSVWEHDLFYNLVQVQLERLNQAHVPVTWHTLDHAKDAPPAPTSSVPVVTEMSNDPYVSAAESLLQSYSTTSAGAWIERISFVFPNRVSLTLKSSAPLEQQLNVEVRSWSEAHAHKNRSMNLEVNMNGFHEVKLSHSLATEQSGEEMFLGSMKIYTQVVEIELEDTIDSVFILTDLNKAKELRAASADQVFTNLGYFFYFSVGTSSIYTAQNHWTAGVATAGEHTHVPNLFSSPAMASQLVKTTSARFVSAESDSQRYDHISLPGSGVLSLVHEGFASSGLVGVSRSLTPLSTGVDLTAYWGVSVLLRLLTNAPLTIQLQIETSSVTDYAFHKSDIVHVNQQDCWLHVQLPWSAFHSTNGRPLDVTTITKLTLIVPVVGPIGLASQLEVANFAIQTHALTNAVRQLMAPCSVEDTYPSSGQTAVRVSTRASHYAVGSHMRKADFDGLVEMAPPVSAATTASASSILLLAATILSCLGLLRWM